MAYTTSPSTAATTAALVQPGDVVTGIPQLCRGQRATVVTVHQLVQARGYEPKVDLEVRLSHSDGYYTYRVPADHELGLISTALGAQLVDMLAELYG